MQPERSRWFPNLHLSDKVLGGLLRAGSLRWPGCLPTGWESHLLGPKPVKSGQKRSKTPLHHRPPHAWPTLADTVLAWPPPQPHTSASANRDIQARGKITLPPQISLPTFPKPDIKFDFLLKVRVLDDSAAGRIEAIHPTRPLVHDEAPEPDDGAEDPRKVGSSALLWRL